MTTASDATSRVNTCGSDDQNDSTQKGNMAGNPRKARGTSNSQSATVGAQFGAGQPPGRDIPGRAVTPAAVRDQAAGEPA